MTSGDLRLAELLGGLSLACDLANGCTPGKVLRTTVLAVELAKRHGLSAETQRDVFYVNLLRYLGCTAFSHEEAHRYGAGDDIQTRRTMALADMADVPGTLGRVLAGIGRGGSRADRAQAVVRILGDGESIERHARSQCDASVRMAEIVQLGPRVCGALRQICERWDGKGVPARQRGDELDLAIRLHHVADVIELVHQTSGRDAALLVGRQRAGGQLDPDLVATFTREAPSLFDAIEDAALWERFVAIEPRPSVIAEPGQSQQVALAFAHFTDLKSVYTLGHSSAVAELVAQAASGLSLSDEERACLRCAALLHDLGRVAVPTGLWDKPGRLTEAERERIRLHAYYSERVLVRAPAWRPLAAIAAAAHERADGSGYHRGVPRALLPVGARLLAVADALQAMREPRPYRPARSIDQIARELRVDAREGRLDAELVTLTLDAAQGFTPRLPTRRPAGLTEREVEVLRCLARGQSNKQIADELDISAKTVQHHIAHVYDKIGVSSRAAAALFAVEQRLLDGP